MSYMHLMYIYDLYVSIIHAHQSSAIEQGNNIWQTQWDHAYRHEERTWPVIHYMHLDQVRLAC